LTYGTVYDNISERKAGNDVSRNFTKCPEFESSAQRKKCQP